MVTTPFCVVGSPPFTQHGQIMTTLFLLLNFLYFNHISLSLHFIDSVNNEESPENKKQPPFKKAQKEMHERSIYTQGYPAGTTTEAISDAFSKFGKVKRVVLDYKKVITVFTVKHCSYSYIVLCKLILKFSNVKFYKMLFFVW